MTKRPPLTALETKRCCHCKHWHRTEPTKGQCRHPQKYWGATDSNAGYTVERHVAWLTTGCYATCEKWEAKK